ncbi:MAG TPA: hemerythrin domain-containing protein [Gammaproteobacteria bacterium]
MFGFFKKSAAQPQEQQSPTTEPQPEKVITAPGTEIRYSPTLIDELKSDHQKLLGAYMAIKASFEQGNYTAVSQQLNLFRYELHNHLLTENVRLYIYVGRMLEQDEDQYGTIRNFRHEMEGIGKTALRLLKQYEEININQELADPFARDFAAIGSILTERIKKEESVLYPLYKANY